MTVGPLIAGAFMRARSRYPELNRTWVKVSFKAGGRLPASLLMVNIQRDGELDLVIRCMEDEVAQDVERGGSDELFVGNYLSVLSN
jgi:hypothetical protein